MKNANIEIHAKFRGAKKEKKQQTIRDIFRKSLHHIDKEFKALIFFF